MKSGKKITTLLLTLIVLVLAVSMLYSCSETVTVTFETDGGTVVPSVTINPGETVTAPANPTREGYIFAGWTTEDGTLWNFIAPVMDDTLLIANWVKDDSGDFATVSLDIKGGDKTDYATEITVQKGAVIETPKAPVKNGYAFLGWYFNGEEFSFTNYVIAEDITLVAHWQPVVYSVTYELSGGTLDFEFSEYTTEADAVIPAASRDGYEFLGWIYEGVGNPVKSLVFPKGTYGNIALTACWQAIEYNISYELSGGAYPAGVPVYETYNTESESFLVFAPQKEHYDFVGWQVNGEGEPVLSLTVETGSVGDLELTAVYKPHEYAIEYDLGAGAVNNPENPLYVTVEGDAVTLKAPTLHGYKLVGWQIGDSDEVLEEVTIAKGTVGEIKLTAVWAKGTYTATYFSFNGKTHAGESLTETFTLDSLPVKLPTLYLNNKCFISWYTDDGFTNPITEITECKDITLYAKIVDASDGLVYSFNGETYDVTGYSGNADVVYIPELYKEIPVTSIASGVFEGKALSEIYLPETIESIGEKAFYTAENLKNVYIVKDSFLSSIGKLAFAGSALLGFDAPTALAYIGDGAFLGCESFVYMNFEETSLEAIGASAFEGTRLEKITLPASLKSIGAKAFLGVASLKSVSFAENASTAEILDGAFMNCLALETVAFPASLETIGASAFENCINLKELAFAEDSSLASIGKSAFRNCDAVASVSFPASLVSIGDYAFYSDENLASVSFVSDGALEVIGKNAFANSKIASLTLPENLKVIKESAFAFCYELVSVDFNDSLETIEGLAFNACTALSSIDMPYETKALENSFNGCTGIETLTINMVNPTLIFGGELPSGIKHVTLLNESFIAPGIFAGCSSLESVTLPFVGLTTPGAIIEGEDADREATVDDVKTFAELFGGTVPMSLKTVTVTGGTVLADGAFAGCSYIEKIILPKSTETIGKGAFAGCTSLSYLEMPMSFKGDADFAEMEVEVETEVEGEIVKETVVKTVCTKTLYYVFGGEIPVSLRTVKIFAYGDGLEVLPDGIFEGSSVRDVTLVGFSNISNRAFYNAKALTTLDISACEIVEIGDYAFFGATKLESFTVPASVVYIGAYAFEESGVKEIIFEENSALEVIMDGAFKNCVSLEKITLPSGVTEIADELFLGCTALSSIAISDEVTIIGVSAFEGCASLKSVIFGESSKLSAILNYAFRSSGLESFKLPLSVAVIPNGAFENCASLKNFEFTVPKKSSEAPDSVIIAVDAFKNSALTSIKVPAYVTEILGSAFEGCTSLETVSFDKKSKLEFIGDGAFEGCTALTAIAIPDKVAVISNEIFKNCELLASVSFGENSSLVAILDSAFENCLKLASISLPAGVTAIGDYAFANCFALSNVTLPTGDASVFEFVGEGAFKNCDSLVEITIPAGVLCLSEYMFYNCDKLETVKFEEGSALEGILSNCFLNAVSLKSISVPDTVIYIGASSFSGCASLENVSLGENSQLLRIDASAFMNCSSLAAINLPASLDYIGQEAFRGCTSLELIEISTELDFIDNYAFKNTPKLTLKVYCDYDGEDLVWISGLATYWNTDGNTVEYIVVS